MRVFANDLLIVSEWPPKTNGAAVRTGRTRSHQYGPCDLACLYDARCGLGNYSPLFNPLTYTPHKAYYAFTAFKELRDRGTAVAVQVAGDKNLWVAAAKGEKDAAVMMANDSDKAIPLVCDFQGRAVASCRITDKDRTDATVSFPSELPPRSFLVAILATSASVTR